MYMNVVKAAISKLSVKTAKDELRALIKIKKSALVCDFGGKICLRQKIELEFLAGGVGYGLIELLWRGRTHWSMVIAGGACLVILCAINKMMGQKHIILRAAAGAIAITAIEFAVGIVVNRVLGLGVWNYGEMFGNVMGQICPLYSFLWFLLCIPVLTVAKKLETCVCSSKKVKSKS
jgi:hypothetical protein